MVEDKEIVLAIFSSSFAIAGLLLVFAGFLFSAYSSFPVAGTTEETLRPYKEAIWGAMLVLVLDTLVVAAALSWLLTEQTFWLVISLFALVVLSLPFLAGRAAFLVLRRR